MFAHLGFEIGDRSLGTLGEINVPPLARGRQRLAAFEQHEVPGGKLLHPFDPAGVVGDIAEGEKVLDGVWIKFATNRRIGE